MKRLILSVLTIILPTIAYGAGVNVATQAYVDDVAQTKQDKLKAGSNITIGTDGTISATDTTYQPFNGGATGLVSAASSDDSNKFLRGDGTWGTPAGGGTGSLPAVPSGGKYKLVSNGTELSWEAEECNEGYEKNGSMCMCPSGSYDIGFDQCISVSTSGSDYGYYDLGGDKKK